MVLSSTNFTTFSGVFHLFFTKTHKKEVHNPQIVEKSGAKHKMYPLFHILNVENFFVRISLKFVKLMNFTNHLSVTIVTPSSPSPYIPNLLVLT